MADVLIRWRGTQRDVNAAIRLLGQVFAGQRPDPWGIVDGIKLRLANVLLSKIQQDFVAKSRGNTGEDGIQWKPLKRETVAQRRTTRAELRNLGITGRRTRGFLTPAQDKRWKKIFATRKAMFMAKFGLSHKDASARAGQIAWATLKREGAKTKLDVLGNRKVDILRDTGELFQSLTPGIETSASNANGQVLRTPPGGITVGTNKKPWHHKTRPFWPADGDLPHAWWQAILLAWKRGLTVGIAFLSQR